MTLTCDYVTRISDVLIGWADISLVLLGCTDWLGGSVTCIAGLY